MPGNVEQHCDELIGVLKEFPYWKKGPLRMYVVKQRRLMSRRQFEKALSLLWKRNRIEQPRANCIALSGPELLEHQREHGNTPFAVLMNGEPSINPIISNTCSYSHRFWRLEFKDGKFVLECNRLGGIQGDCRTCRRTKSGDWAVHGALFRILRALAALQPLGPKVSVDNIRSVCDNLKLNSIKTWDIYACLLRILRLRSGMLDDEQLYIGSKILRRLVAYYKGDSAGMSRGSLGRFGFVVQAIKLLPVQLAD